MRIATVALLGLFLSAALIGCGASVTIPDPPEKAKAGPPPGTSADLTKIMDKKKK